MKQLIRTGLAGFIGLVAGMGIMFASAAGTQPGSELDPLVTKSYVDQKIAALAGQTGATLPAGVVATTVDSAAVTQLQTDVGELTHFIIDALTGVESLKARLNALESGFVAVEVPVGKTVVLGGGAEVIVRSGKTVAVAGTNGGLADVTTGVDLKGGAAVSNQHLLISSRTDGRGLKINAQTAFLLIRGSYSIK
jgi:hypothetical protein